MKKIRLAAGATVLFLGFAIQAAGAVEPSSLVKGSQPSVYYVDGARQRHAFPNDRVFFTWYESFDKVQGITDDELAKLPLGGNVTYKPGARLVKITTDPKVYAVARGGQLRWVNDEATAIALYGTGWANLVHDLSDAFFANYLQGPPIGSVNDFQPYQEFTASPAIGYDLEFRKALIAQSSAANQTAPSTPTQITQPQTSQNPATSQEASQNSASNQTPTAAPAHVPFQLKSKYFSSDARAQQIASTGSGIDLVQAGLADKASPAFRVYGALLMLGYSPQDADNAAWLSGDLKTLHRFQRNNSLPEGNLLTAATLQKMDELLFQREALYQPYAEAFPFRTRFKTWDQNDVPKEFVAAIYQMPFSVLPKRILMDDGNYAICILGTCMGDVLNADGTEPNFAGQVPSLPVGWLFDDMWFSRSTASYLPQNASVDIYTILHEYAHAIDGISTAHEAYTVDTAEFYDIGFVLPEPGSGILLTCGVRRSSSIQDFLTAYGYYASANKQNLYCPEGRVRVNEDFADSFAAYVAAGRKFRSAAAKSEYIKKKYDWLKTNVFENVEYDTDLVVNGVSGCADEPGYLSCSEEYVWDGTLKKL